MLHESAEKCRRRAKFAMYYQLQMDRETEKEKQTQENNESTYSW